MPVSSLSSTSMPHVQCGCDEDDEELLTNYSLLYSVAHRRRGPDAEPA